MHLFLIWQHPLDPVEGYLKFRWKFHKYSSVPALILCSFPPNLRIHTAELYSALSVEKSILDDQKFQYVR